MKTPLPHLNSKHFVAFIAIPSVTMALFYHRAVDFLSDDPFEHVEVLQYPSAASAEHVGSAEIDDDILATPYQTQIVSMEQAQWCKVRIVLPTNPRPTIERIKATWRQIAYHRKLTPRKLRLANMVADRTAQTPA